MRARIGLLAREATAGLPEEPFMGVVDGGLFG